MQVTCLFAKRSSKQRVCARLHVLASRTSVLTSLRRDVSANIVTHHFSGPRQGMRCWCSSTAHLYRYCNKKSMTRVKGHGFIIKTIQTWFMDETVFNLFLFLKKATRIVQICVLQCFMCISLNEFQTYHCIFQFQAKPTF